MDAQVTASRAPVHERVVTIPAQGSELIGTLRIPERARGMVVVALDGGGRSGAVPVVAAELHRGRFATLVCDLAGPSDLLGARSRRATVVETPLLAARLAAVATWARHEDETSHLPIGYLGAGLASAAALVDAAQCTTIARAMVSSGGRPDLVARLLPDVRVATLLLVGGYDEPLLDLNRDALSRLGGVKALRIVPRATHLLEEPDAAARVGRYARRWFEQHLGVRTDHPTLSGGGW